jgi:hypothetical protein
MNRDRNKEKDMEMSKVVSGEEVEMLAIATTGGPAPAGDVVATVYKDSPALYVEPLPPQSLTCVKPVGAVGCPVARVWYGFGQHHAPPASRRRVVLRWPPTSAGTGSSSWDTWRR